MFERRSNFLSYRFPNAGQFYADSNCTKPLFIGQLEIVDDNIFIKVLSEQEHYYRYPDTLYALLNTVHEPQKLVAYSFFRCATGRSPIVDNIIRFGSFIRHDNGNHKGWSHDFWVKDDDISLPEFMTEQNLFKKISLRISKLDEWLWNLNSEEQVADMKLKHPKFSAQYADKKGCSYRGYRTWNGYMKNIDKMIIPFKSLTRKIKLDDNTTIVFYSEPYATGSEFPNFCARQDSSIEIIRVKPQSIDFFIRIIYKIKMFLSIITNSECKIYSISYHEVSKFNKKGNKVKPYKNVEFFYNDLGWYLNTDPLKDWFVGYHMLYRTISNDLERALKCFFRKYNEIDLVLRFLLNAKDKREKESFDLYLATQLQIIEMYGNSKTKGAKPREDINIVISEVPNKIFDNIFIHYYETRNSIPCVEIFGQYSDSKNADPEEILKYRKILQDDLMNVRNLIIHPYKNGKLKKVAEQIAFVHWHAPDGKHLNWPALSQLSISLNMMLRYFVLKEIGLDKFWHI